MSRRIDRNEIAEKGVLDNLLEPLKELIKVSDRVDTKLKSTAKTINESFKFTESSKGLRDLEQNLKRTNKLAEEKKRNQQDQTKVQKQLANAQQRLNSLSEKEAKELIRTREAIRKKTNSLKASGNAYKQLSNESRDLKNESKRLGAELLKLEANGGKNTKEFRKLEKQYEDTTQQARKTDAQLKDLDKTVGDNFRNVGNYESATDKLRGSLKNLAGAIGIGAAVNGLKNFAMEASRAENMARTFFDTNEQGTKDIAREANILAKVYGKDVNEVLKSANVLSKQFGLTGQESIAMLNKGFEKGGDVSGELLENVAEYSTQLRLAGLNAEQSLSIITQSQQQGVFSDKGVDAIKEATLSLREMTPPAQEALEAIGMSAEQVQKDIASGSKSYFDVIQEVSSKTKEVGENSQEAGMILADIFKGAGEDAGDFIFQLDKMNTSLDGLEDQNQGLDGAVKNLTRSWNEFLYGVNEGTGAMDAFSGVINFVAENLGAIIKTLGRLAALYLIIKARQKIINSGMLDYAKNLFKAKGAQNDLNKSMSKGGGSAKGFGKALKGIGWAALIGVAIELAVAFYDIASGAAEARRKAKELDDYRKSASKDANERLTERNKKLDLEIKAIERKKDIAISEAKSEKNRDEIRARFLKDRLKLIEQNNSLIENDINAVTKRQKKYQEFQTRLKDELDIWKDLKEAGKRDEAGAQMVKVSKLAADLGNELGLTSEAWFGLIEQNATWTEVQSNLDARVAATNDKLKIYNDELIGSKENLKDVSTEIKVDSNERENNRSKINAQVKGLKDQNDELERQILNLKDIDKLLNEGQSLEQIEEEEIGQENAKIQRILDERLTMINDTERLGTLTEEEAQDQREIMQLEALLAKKKLLEQYGRDTVEIDKAISEKRLQISKESKDEEVKVEEDKGKELLETATAIQDAITEAYIDSVDRRIEKLQEEQNAAEAQQKYLQELAKNGQIDAQQSLLATQRQAEELEREQRKLEKRKAQIQLISTGLSTYANAIEQGKSPAEALTSTIANTQLLVSGLKSIQAFKDGSEDVGNGGRMDKDGGFLAMLHPKERVMTAEQNAKVSGLSNPLLAEIGHKFKSGELTERGGQVGYDLNAVVAELQELKSTIKNKPEHYVNFESIAGKMYLNHTKKAGKTIIINKYKVN